MNEPERSDINKAAARLNDIWQSTLKTYTKGCYYKWCAVGVGESHHRYKYKSPDVIYLYLDCKTLPPEFEYYGWKVIPVKSTQPKPLGKK